MYWEHGIFTIRFQCRSVLSRIDVKRTGTLVCIPHNTGQMDPRSMSQVTGFNVGRNELNDRHFRIHLVEKSDAYPNDVSDQVIIARAEGFGVELGGWECPRNLNSS